MLEDWTDKELGNSKTQNAEMNYQSTANTSQGNEQDSLLPENHSSSTLADHIQINKPSQELPTSFRDAKRCSVLFSAHIYNMEGKSSAQTVHFSTFNWQLSSQNDRRTILKLNHQIIANWP